MQHLRRLGFPTEPLVWTSEADCAESQVHETLVIVRSCWDYHIQPARFLEWADSIGLKGGRVLNPPSTIRWNHDKRYLSDFQTSGVRIAPTVWVETGAKSSLEQIMEEAGWAEVVVKPAVSATAWRTIRVERQAVSRFERAFHEIVQSGCALVQQFVKDVLTGGEWSFVFFDGVYSHAVLKRPAQLDFRVQHEFGGTVDRKARPHPGLIEAASFALRQCPGDLPLYARVDGIETSGIEARDSLIIMEVELIEPALFLDGDDAAAARFARAIAARADNRLAHRGLS